MKIKEVTPRAGIEGGKVSIQGTGFDPEASESLQISFGGVAARPLLISSSRIISEIPENAKEGPIKVKIKRRSSSVRFHVGRKLVDDVRPVDNPVYDKVGNLYVTFSAKRGETVPVSIFKISPEGDLSPFVSNIPNATSLAFDASGDLFVSSRFEGVVYRVTPDADVTIFAKDLGIPTGLAFNEEGILFAGDRSGRILKILPDGESRVFVEIPESHVAVHLAFDRDGNLLVSSPSLSSYNDIWMIDPFGKLIPLHGGFGRPQGVTVDHQGNIYLCEAKAGDSAIFRISPTGDMETLVTGPVMVGVALDQDGNLAVATEDALYIVPIGSNGGPGR